MPQGVNGQCNVTQKPPVIESQRMGQQPGRGKGGERGSKLMFTIYMYRHVKVSAEVYRLVLHLVAVTNAKLQEHN